MKAIENREKKTFNANIPPVLPVRLRLFLRRNINAL